MSWRDSLVFSFCLSFWLGTSGRPWVFGISCRRTNCITSSLKFVSNLRDSEYERNLKHTQILRLGLKIDAFFWKASPNHSSLAVIVIKEKGLYSFEDVENTKCLVGNRWLTKVYSRAMISPAQGLNVKALSVYNGEYKA